MSTDDYKEALGRADVVVDEVSAARRPRNAAATRAAILAAARRLFTAHGFDGVGVRDVGAVAGVNAALVQRYFGSKLGLFDEAVSGTFTIEGLVRGDRSTIGERLARYLLTKDRTGQEFDPTLAMLRSAAHPEAAASMRAALDEQFVRPLADWIGGDGAERRAGMVLATIAGLALMRDIIGVGALSDDPEALAREMGPVLQRLVRKEGTSA